MEGEVDGSLVLVRFEAGVLMVGRTCVLRLVL